MKIIYSDAHWQHNPKYEIYDGVKESYAEKADRLGSIVNALQRSGLQLVPPRMFPQSAIEEVHKKEYIHFLKARSLGIKKDGVLYPSYFLMDTYTPVTRGTFGAARQAVNVALTGANLLRAGERLVYSLCRPPGHHAEYKAMGGYCYFNNAAIAANFLSKYGRVAILDIDFHHGNGTQNIFYERNDVLYVSLHADPRVRFPYSSGFRGEMGVGRGKGYTVNYPLPLGAANTSYLQTLHKALNDIKKFKPEYLVVSLGFDTYEKDPIGGFKLTEPFYHIIGEEIAQLNLPILLVQEGGYFVKDLGALALSFLSGISAIEK